MYALERMAIGPFSVEQAVDLDELHSVADVEKQFIPIESFLQQL